MQEYNPFEQAERDAAAAEELEPSSLDFLFLVRSMDRHVRWQLLIIQLAIYPVGRLPPAVSRMTRRTREPLSPSLKLGQRWNRKRSETVNTAQSGLRRCFEQRNGRVAPPRRGSGEVKLHSADMLGMGFERSVDPAPAPQAAQQPRPTDTGCWSLCWIFAFMLGFFLNYALSLRRPPF